LEKTRGKGAEAHRHKAAKAKSLTGFTGWTGLLKTLEPLRRMPFEAPLTPFTKRGGQSLGSSDPSPPYPSFRKKGTEFSPFSKGD